MQANGSNHEPQPPVRGACRWLHTPILPADLPPNGLPGLLWIEAQTQRGRVGECYMLTPIAEAGRLLGWRLTKSDGTCYDVDGVHGSCDCPDSQFRHRPCKHCRALAAGLRAIGIKDPPLCGSLTFRRFDNEDGPDRAA